MRSSTVIGSLRRTADGRGAVRMEDVYDTDIDDLWSTLTDPDRLAQWVARVDGDLRVGGQIRAHFTSEWDGPGRIDVCQAPHRLTVTMAPGTPEETVIDATLATEDGRTRLVVEERGISIDALPSHGAGWQAHVEDLAAHVEGRSTATAADWHSRWTALTPAYRGMPIDAA